MYESPIEFFTKTAAPKIAAKIDEQALEAVFQCGFNVDRDELEKALRYDRDQWRKGFADGVEHAQPKWISVKDRMPERFISVLVHMPGETPHPTVHEGYMGVKNWYAGGFSREDCEITHWMPLPEPPKEE